MEKVLILSYFFPPCNLTPSQRVISWAKYLNEFGYYPVIITRRWDYKINTPNDSSIKTPSDIIHEKYPEYEVYYLPYSPNLKDRIYSRYGEKKKVLLRKFLSFAELILQNISVRIIPFNNIYFFSLKYLKKNKDIKKMVVTANPYILFKFAYKLHSKTGVKWVADYRDAWSNSKINNIDRNKLYQWISRYDSVFEKSWVGTASAITSVSDNLAKHISSFVFSNSKNDHHKPRIVGTISNGFIEEDFDSFRNELPFEAFTITYTGTLFSGQKIEIFLEAFKSFINKTRNTRHKTTETLKIKLLMPGLGFKKDIAEMVISNMKGFESYYEITERIEREEILKIEVKSHLLLYVAWQGYNGIVPSKIYEYIASGTYILVAPTDKDAVEDIVNSSGCGICLSTTDEISNFLNDLYSKYLKGEKVVNDLNNDKVKQFSRKLQVEKLSNILNKL